MNFLKLAMIVGAVALFMSPSLRASTTTFAFSNCAELTPSPLPGCPPPNIDAGTNHLTYTSDGLTVGTYGYTTGGSAIDLYIKSLGTNETGLGTIIDSADHEITPDDFVNLDLSNLVAQGYFSGTIQIESLQTGEGYTLCQGATLGALGSSCLLTQNGRRYDQRSDYLDRIDRRHWNCWFRQSNARSGCSGQRIDGRQSHSGTGDSYFPGRRHSSVWLVCAVRWSSASNSTRNFPHRARFRGPFFFTAHQGGGL